MELKDLLEGASSYSKALALAATTSVVFPILAVVSTGADPLDAIAAETLATLAGMIAFVVVSQLTKHNASEDARAIYARENLHIIGSLIAAFVATLVFWRSTQKVDVFENLMPTLLLCVANASICYGIARKWTYDELVRVSQISASAAADREYGDISIDDLMPLHSGLGVVSLEPWGNPILLQKFQVTPYVFPGTRLLAFKATRKVSHIALSLFTPTSSPTTPKISSKQSNHIVCSVLVNRKLDYSELEALTDAAKALTIDTTIFKGRCPLEIVLTGSEGEHVDESALEALGCFVTVTTKR